MISTARHGLSACRPKPALRKRPLLALDEAAELAGLYETLANDTRLRLLHALAREGALTPSTLADRLAMKPQAVSNQLLRLTDRGVVQARREGNHVFYRIVDPCVIDLVERGLCLLEEASAARPARRRAA